MPSITLNINDLVKLSQSPAFSADNLKRHARKLMQKYAKVAYSSTIDAFSNERDPITEQPWAPRCPAYIKHLMRIGRGNSKILQLSLRLRNDVKPFYYDDKAGVGVNLKYAAIHQFGGRAGKDHRAKIPARPYLGLDQPAREKIVRLTVKMLNEAITEELAKSLNS